ncbi:MAG: DNRLRE domain-containing protein [Thaumarchaeota archaeon]|nr:DNRLRE domain-containing protein [Nitrososphaerota archaeon]
MFCFDERRAAHLLVGILIILALSQIPVQAAEEQTATLNPEADAYADSGVAGVHPQGPQYLFVANNKDLSVDARYWHVGPSWVYIRFDLSALPRGSVVTSAKLQTYAVFVTQPHIVGAHSTPVNSWDSAKLDFKNAPKFDDRPEDIQQVVEESRWYEWKITHMANETVHSSDRKLTVVLASEDEHRANNWVGLYSTRQGNATSNLVPKLVITYIPGGGASDYLGDFLSAVRSIRLPETSLPSVPTEGIVVLFVVLVAFSVLAVRRRMRVKKMP